MAAKEMQHIGDIIMAAFTKVPEGYLPCDGRELSVAQNQALYAILGARYGGNGVTTFKLPDLRGKVPIGAGQAPGLLNYPLATTGGATKVTVDVSNLPAHTHTVREDRLSLPAGDNNDTHNPTGAYAGTSTTGNLYSSTAGTGTSAKLPDTLQLDNGVSGPPVDNMQPYLAISFFITVDGLFPSRS